MHLLSLCWSLAHVLPLHRHRSRVAARGAVHVEYLMVVLCLSLGAAFALTRVGPGLYELVLIQASWLGLPIP